MIAFHEVQQAAVDLIDAHAYFAAEEVIADDGLKEKEIESALRDRGFVVFVPPLLGASLKSQGKDKAVVDSDLMVCVYVNPKVNADVGKANKDIAEAIEKICEAMLEYDDCEKVPMSKFRLAPEAVVISNFDPGLFAYELFFQRMCVL